MWAARYKFQSYATKNYCWNVLPMTSLTLELKLCYCYKSCHAPTPESITLFLNVQIRTFLRIQIILHFIFSRIIVEMLLQCTVTKSLSPTAEMFRNKWSKQMLYDAKVMKYSTVMEHERIICCILKNKRKWMYNCSSNIKNTLQQHIHK